MGWASAVGALQHALRSPLRGGVGVAGRGGDAVFLDLERCVSD